jgi:hypothetical protein
MLPHQDEILLALIRCHVEDGGPLEPIVDRCIEMRHYASWMDRYSSSAWLAWPEAGRLLHRVVFEVNEALQDLGHDDLADMIPF